MNNHSGYNEVVKQSTKTNVVEKIVAMLSEGTFAKVIKSDDIKLNDKIIVEETNNQN